MKRTPVSWVTRAALVLRLGIVATLLILTTGTAQAGSHGPAHRAAWSAFPVADGTVTDSDRDGRGDVLLDGANSVVVGYNALGPGEHRGVYEFDVRALPRLRDHDRLMLWLNQTGTRMDGTLPLVTLYAGQGNGVLTAADFAAGRWAATFESLGLGPDELGPDSGWYDNRIDVTQIVRRLTQRGARCVVFVIRPNPAAQARQGALLLSSMETAAYSEQFVPARLVLERRSHR